MLTDRDWDSPAVNWSAPEKIGWKENDEPPGTLRSIATSGGVAVGSGAAVPVGPGVGSDGCGVLVGGTVVGGTAVLVGRAGTGVDGNGVELGGTTGDAADVGLAAA